MEKEMQVKVTFPIDKVKTGVEYDEEAKELVAVIQLKVKVHPADLARIFNLQRIEAPLMGIIGSNQAELDLRIQQIDKNGEINELADKNLIGK